MKIYCDMRVAGSAREQLQDGIKPHELAFASNLTSSVLAAGGPDEAMASAEIAFGQPDAATVLAAKSLQWVHITSAGFTRYDTPQFRAAALERGLLLTNSSTVYAEACAEHAMAFVLAQARQLPRALRSHAASGEEEWVSLRHQSTLLRGQRALLFGYGAIAARLAVMLAAFHVEVTAVRRRLRGDETLRVITPEAADEELSTADHVIDILPENEDSTGYFGAARLERCKNGAIFYNIGRGATVRQDDLAAALEHGRLAAAWLDVTTPEPLPKDHALRQLENCHITPHIAGGQRAEPEALVRHFLENLRRFEAGIELHDRVY